MWLNKYCRIRRNLECPDGEDLPENGYHRKRRKRKHDFTMLLGPGVGRFSPAHVAGIVEVTVDPGIEVIRH